MLALPRCPSPAAGGPGGPDPVPASTVLGAMPRRLPCLVGGHGTNGVRGKVGDALLLLLFLPGSSTGGAWEQPLPQTPSPCVGKGRSRRRGWGAIPAISRCLRGPERDPRCLRGGRTALSGRLQDSDRYFEDLVTERLIPVTDLCFKPST